MIEAPKTREGKFTFKFDPVSKNGVLLKLGDIVFQMIVRPKELPELIPLKIIELVYIKKKLKVLSLHPKYSNSYEVDPKDVHTDPQDLCEAWIVDLQSLADFIPKQIEQLKLLSQTKKEYVIDREIGEKGKEEEI